MITNIPRLIAETVMSKRHKSDPSNFKHKFAANSLPNLSFFEEDDEDDYYAHWNKRSDKLELTPEQYAELYEFIEEALLIRDRRVPELEASLAEANAIIAQYASSRRQTPTLLSAANTGYDTLVLEEALTALRLEPEQSVNKQPSLQPSNQSAEREESDLLMILAEQLAAVEDENRRMRETLERYEVAVARFKGDKHMLLTDALKTAFTSPNYKLLLDDRKEEKVVEKQDTGVETDPIQFLQEETVNPDLVQIPTSMLAMMQGCWMYKYPRSRFHKLISTPCIPLGKLTYRYFWFCPVNRSIMWTEKSTIFRNETSKIVRIKDVVCEKRSLDKPGKDGLSGQVEVIVIVAEEGPPLALIPLNADEFTTWKEGIFSILGKSV